LADADTGALGSAEVLNDADVTGLFGHTVQKLRWLDRPFCCAYVLPHRHAKGVPPVLAAPPPPPLPGMYRGGGMYTASAGRAEAANRIVGVLYGI